MIILRRGDLADRLYVPMNGYGIDTVKNDKGRFSLVSTMDGTALQLGYVYFDDEPTGAFCLIQTSLPEDAVPGEYRYTVTGQVDGGEKVISTGLLQLLDDVVTTKQYNHTTTYKQYGAED